MTTLNELLIVIHGIKSLKNKINAKLVNLMPKIRKEDQDKSYDEKCRILMQRQDFQDLFERLHGMYAIIGDGAQKFEKELKNVERILR